MRPISLLSALVLGALLPSCAGQECDFHSQCGDGFYCRLGSCQQDCRRDFDCSDGLRCSEIGQCLATSDAGDAGPRPDAGPLSLDAGPPPEDAGPGHDAGLGDAGPGTHDSGPGGTDSGPGGTDSGPGGTDSGPGGADAGPGSSDAGAAADAGAPGPVPRGSYRYTMLPLGVDDVVRVEFHPDGAYAVILARSNYLYVYDWSTRTVQSVNLDISGTRSATYFYDSAFDPSGDFFYVVGAEYRDGPETGVIFRVDDAMVRAGMLSAAVTQLSDTRAGERFTAIEYPIAPRTGGPVVLSTTPSAPYVARLRELDTSTGAFTGLFLAHPTGAACMDMAWSNNGFGGWGIAIVGGPSGADAPYYTEIEPAPYEWTPAPSGTLGNVHRIAAHPSGDYALGIGASGWGNIHRIEGGVWHAASTSPSWTYGLYAVAFQQEGQRALVLGPDRGSPLVGTVLEYRHDRWSASEVTDVSIPNFGATPISADGNYQLNDAAFRPGCDGGLIVAGRSSFSINRGVIIEFAIEGLRSCGGLL